jgi:hypothetical protein
MEASGERERNKMARKKIEYDNSKVVEALRPYATWTEAAKEFRFLDHILTGLANLDHDGNSRPVAMPMLYSLLSTMPVLTTEAVREATGYGKSHGSSVRRLVEMASSAFEAQLAIRVARCAAQDVSPKEQMQELKAETKVSLVQPPPDGVSTFPSPTPSPQELLLLALEQCRRAYGDTLYTALRAYHGDIGAVLEKVLGSVVNRELVEAGVLLVDHDLCATARPPVLEPPRLKQRWTSREEMWRTQRRAAKSLR